MDITELARSLEIAPLAVPEAPVASASAMLDGLSIEKLENGSLRIEAAPQLAAPLAALFEQLAGGLRSVAPAR